MAPKSNERPCVPPPQQNLTQAIARAAEALAEMVDPAEEAGVLLVIESSLAFHQQEFLLNYLGSTGAVKVCCNTAVALSRKFDVVTGIRQLSSEAIAYVRLKDVRIAEGKPPDFTVPLGEGDVDFRAVMQALRAVGYDGWAVVDPPPSDEALRKPLPAARKAVDFARKVVQGAPEE